MERAYRQEVGAYSLNLNDLGVQIMAGARYQYTVTSNDLSTEFLATAAALNEDLDDDATVDTWTIDQTGSLTNTINDVTG
jgi:hypothetical protein